MRFSGPDHAVIAAWEALCEASATKAVDLSAMEGLWHARRCDRCQSTTYHEVASSGGGIIERCKRCNAMWRTRPACVPKGVFQSTSTTTRGTGPMVRSADLAEIVSRVPEDTMRVYACWLIVGRGWPWTASYAADHDWPGGPWDESAVRRAVRRGRKWLSAELEACGLLQEAA